MEIYTFSECFVDIHNIMMQCYIWYSCPWYAHSLPPLQVLKPWRSCKKRESRLRKWESIWDCSLTLASSAGLLRNIRECTRPCMHLALFLFQVCQQEVLDKSTDQNPPPDQSYSPSGGPPSPSAAGLMGKYLSVYVLFQSHRCMLTFNPKRSMSLYEWRLLREFTFNWRILYSPLLQFHHHYCPCLHAFTWTSECG